MCLSTPLTVDVLSIPFLLFPSLHRFFLAASRIITMAGPACYNFQERHHEPQLEPSIVLFDWVVHVFRYLNLDLGASSTGRPRLLHLLGRLPRNANVGAPDDRMPLRFCCFGDNVTWHGTWDSRYGIGEHTEVITGITLSFNANGPGWPLHSAWLTRVTLVEWSGLRDTPN